MSWSGITSRAVAEALADWLPKVIQGIKPFLSAKDIDKGANWTLELSRELSDAEFGIVCLAPDNLQSPWINYEAGAITRSVDSRVCPVLFRVDKSAVQSPLSQLQLTSLDPDDVHQLMQSMNRASGSLLGDVALQEAVSMWWPILKTKLDQIPEPAATDQGEPVKEPAKPKADQGEMLEELLRRVRSLDSRVESFDGRLSPQPFAARREREIRSGVFHKGEDIALSPIRDLQAGYLLDLLHIAAEVGLEATKGPPSLEGFDIQFSNQLPEVLPTDLYAAGALLAKENGVQVRFIGPNRTATFDSNGRTSEVPF